MDMQMYVNFSRYNLIKEYLNADNEIKIINSNSQLYHVCPTNKKVCATYFPA